MCMVFGVAAVHAVCYQLFERIEYTELATDTGRLTRQNVTTDPPAAANCAGLCLANLHCHYFVTSNAQCGLLLLTSESCGVTLSPDDVIFRRLQGKNYMYMYTYLYMYMYIPYRSTEN